MFLLYAWHLKTGAMRCAYAPYDTTLVGSSSLLTALNAALTSVIEPLLALIMGAVVLLIVLTILLPNIQMNQVVKRAEI
jgi:hypothetical protein